MVAPWGSGPSGTTEEAGGTSAIAGTDENMTDDPANFTVDAPKRRFPVRLVVAVTVALFVASTALAYELGTQGAAASPGPNNPSSAVPVTLTINNPFDTANNGSADQYSPANFSVPANTLLEFVITNYDNGVNPPPPQYTNASGVNGNCVYVNATPAGLGPCSHSLPADQIAHTFTIPALSLNVPVPTAANTSAGASGAQVIFIASFDTPGSYTWQCMAPCDPWSMETPGFMQGTMTVT